MFTKDFWLDAFERATKTFAQSLLSAPLAAAATAAITSGVGADLQFILLNATIAAIISILTSVAGNSFGTRGSPSLLNPSIESQLVQLSQIEPVAKTNDAERVAGAIPPSLAGR